MYYFSLSPIHLETSAEEDIEKKVELVMLAVAFAINDFPVPGGFKGVSENIYESRYSIEKYSFPWFSLSSKQLSKF